MNDNSGKMQALFKDVFGLGGALAYFPVKQRSQWGSLIVGLLLVALAVLVPAGAAVYTYLQIDRLGPAVQDRVFREVLYPFACGGAIAGGIGLAFLWSAYSNWNRAAAVYRDGIVYNDRNGMRQLRWTDLRSMTSAVTRHYRNGIYTGTTHVYTLLDREGKKLVLNDALQNVEQLADQVQQGIFPHLYQAAADRYNSGKPVEFGPVTISKEGIQVGSKAYKWDEVEGVTIEKGFLKVARRGGGWFSGANASAASIPNVSVLLSIIHQISGVKTG